MRLRLLALAAAALAAAAPAYAFGHGSAAPPTLLGKVGKGNSFAISLTKGGRPVSKVKLRAGTYTIAVNDYSSIHNFRLKGPGVNKATTIPQIAIAKWTVRLRKGVYTVVCDPHVTSMRFTFRVS